jgi:glycosyltransferase involved in cell wall biosynthesis
MVCGGSYVSGAEIVVLDLLRGLKERGHEVACVMSGWNDGDFPTHLEHLGVPYRPVKTGVVSKRLEWTYVKWTLDALLHLPKAWYDYWSFYHSFDPDVVVFHGVRQASMLRPLLAAEESVHYVHGVPQSSVHHRRLVGGSGHSGRAYVGVSSYVGDALVELGVPEEKVHVVHNGVEDVPEDDLPPTGLSLPPTLGIVGQIGEWKGHPDLLDALQILRERGHDVRCLVFGEGDDDYVDELKQKSEAYGLDSHVEWRGFVTETNALYRELDICVVPSRFQEPFGLVAAEAGVRRIPVVATRRGGLPEIVVDGETGFLIDAECPTQLADRLVDLIEHPDVCARMGKQARERVREKFTRERMVDDAERILRDVASAG